MQFLDASRRFLLADVVTLLRIRFHSFVVTYKNKQKLTDSCQMLHFSRFKTSPFFLAATMSLWSDESWLGIDFPNTMTAFAMSMHPSPALSKIRSILRWKTTRLTGSLRNLYFQAGDWNVHILLLTLVRWIPQCPFFASYFEKIVDAENLWLILSMVGIL